MRGTAAAAAIALVNTVFSLGGFVGPSVVGWFTEATNPSGALILFATVALVAVVLCVTVVRSHPAFQAGVDSDSPSAESRRSVGPLASAMNKMEAS